MNDTPEPRTESVKPTPATPTSAPTDPQPPVQRPQAVQYVVAENQYKGVGGWLVFWLVIFSLFAVGYILGFFVILEERSSSPMSIYSLISSPVLAVLFLAAIVNIAMQKKLGKVLAIAAVAANGISAAFSGIITGFEYSESLVSVVAVVLVSLIISGLVILYFYSSKRVNNTLIR